MTDLTIGLIVLAVFLLSGWLHSAADARDARERLVNHRDALDKLGMFEPKLKEAFGTHNPRWADYREVIDITKVIDLGEIGWKRIEAEEASEEYEQALHILRGERDSDD